MPPYRMDGDDRSVGRRIGVAKASAARVDSNSRLRGLKCQLQQPIVPCDKMVDILGLPDLDAAKNLGGVRQHARRDGVGDMSVALVEVNNLECPRP